MFKTDLRHLKFVVFIFDNKIMVLLGIIFWGGGRWGFCFCFLKCKNKAANKLIKKKLNNIETLSINNLCVFFKSGNLMYQTWLISNEYFIAYFCMNQSNQFTHVCLPRLYEQWRYLTINAEQIVWKWYSVVCMNVFPCRHGLHSKIYIGELDSVCEISFKSSVRLFFIELVYEKRCRGYQQLTGG